MDDSFIDRWKPWYEQDDSQKPYGDTLTYSIGAEFLSGMNIEDWGCGYGWYKSVHSGGYIGVDGTKTQWSDVVADLRLYKSNADGVWIRGVLEHNPEWAKILENVCSSAKQRLVIVVFTPNGDGEQIGYTEALNVPDIALPYSAIDEALEKHNFSFVRHEYKTTSAYGIETVWLAEKR